MEATAKVLEVLLLILFATVHGYFAAWLAVRMLFRPRKPVKVFGITIFPQGMIPRHRDRLAKAIGKVVGEELVSEETLIQELFGKDFLRRKIHSALKEYVENLSKSDLPCIIEAAPEKLREPLLDAAFSLQLKISSYVVNSLKSPVVAASVNDFASRKADQLLAKRLAETLEEDDFSQIKDFLKIKVHKALKSHYLEKKVEEFVSYQMDEVFRSEANLETLFTPDSIELMKEKICDQINPIIHQLTEIATSEKTKSQISAIIKKEVHNYYENLPFFKKIFVSRENLLKEVDSLVNLSLPKKIEETLKADSFATEAKNFLISTIDLAMKKPLKDTLGNLSEESFKKLKRQITVSVLKLIQSEEIKNSIFSYLDELIYKVKPHSLEAILKLIHPESKDVLKKQLSRTILNVLNSEETSLLVSRIISERIENILSEPIGKISNYVSEEKLEEITEIITQIIVDAAKQQLPKAIQEFNIGEIVRQKIDNYPVEKLEELVLSVAKEHLRTIEIFGAIFGFLIGLIQSLLSYFFFIKK
ncbi:MAG: DUF445 domain-containing protein [Pyrinomonadaceae bacterium]|nr:DUF445 domain-containing protein [Pyrinomonadaceae bacterium]